MSRFKLDVGAATDTGRLRDWNEDYFATYVPRSDRGSAMRGLLLVADGVGGENGDADDRRLAVERVLEEIAAEAHRVRLGDATDLEVGEVVRRVIREASGQVLRMGADESPAGGSGATLVMIAFSSEEALVAHAGDSRCFRVRGGGIECLTFGRETGSGVPAGVDVRTELLADRDLFILCSDGVSSALGEDEILEISKRFVRPQDLAEALVALAIGQDGADSATAVVCRCRDAARLEVEPEDTEPIYLPEKRRERTSSLRSWWLIGALALLLVAVAVVGPRWMALRAFDRGKVHAVEGNYLHARREFATAIRLGLDKERTDELIDILLRFPSNRDGTSSTERRAEAEGPDAEPAPASEGPGGSKDGGG